MNIQRLHIDGFGRLNNADFELAPGLNIFGGANEAGKSTLQHAILSLLYGFYSGSRRTTVESDVLEKYRPWLGTTYGGWLEYKLDCGPSFKISRHVEADQIANSIIDTRTNHDLSDGFTRDRLGSLDFPLKHFGVPRDVFEQTYFIRHQELGPLADVAHEVADTISDSTGASRRNRTVARAEELLRHGLAQDVGSKLSTDTPLANADEHVHELLIEKTLIQMRYRNIAEDFVTQRRHKHALKDWTRDRDELKYYLTLSRLQALMFRLREIDKLAAAETALHEQQAELKTVADFPLKTRDVVAELAQRHRTHAERLARFEGMASPARAQVEELQTAAARLREEMRRLESARNVPLEFEQTVRDLEHALPDAIRAYQTTEQELTGIRQAIAALEPARNAAARRKSLVTGGPEKVHELRVRWQAMLGQLADAEHEHAQVDEAWQAQGLSQPGYNELEQQAAVFSQDKLDAIKARNALALDMQKAAETNWKGWLARTLAVAGGGAILIGLTMIVATILDVHTNWLMEGTVFIFAGLLVLAVALVPQRLLMRDQRAAFEASASIQRELAAQGFDSIREMETAQGHLQQARPLHDAWQHSKAALDKYNQERNALRTQILQMMELPETSAVSDEQLAGLETYTRDLGSELEELGRLETKQKQLEQVLGERREAMQKVIDATRQILKAAGMVELNLLADLRTFLVMCVSRRELDKLEGRRQELDTLLASKLETTLNVEADQRAERNRLVGVEEELRLMLKNVGITTESVSDGVKLFSLRCEQAERYTRIQGILHSLERERKALLRSATYEQMKKQADIFSQSLRALLASYPDLLHKTTDRSEETLEESLFEIQHRINTTNHALSAVETRLQSGTTEYRTLAEVEEEIGREQTRMEQLAFEGRAINFSLDQLAAAADDYHRNFLPRLTRMMAASLEAVTNGHYSKVQVDRNDLRVRIEAPELQELIAPERLSRGIQDQVYLLLRFGLAAMISEGRETLPFLFDDPFVNYDHEHLMPTLNLLANAADENQLLLFTKDEVIIEWFKHSKFDATQHKMHEMR